MFTQRGECVTDVMCQVKDEYHVGLDLAFGRTKEQGNKAKLLDFRPLAVKVAA